MTEIPTAATPSASNSEPTSYADAINEVEEILASLEGSAIDVDHLAEQVKRASLLLQICRERLAIVQADVGELVATIGSETTTENTDDTTTDNTAATAGSDPNA